MLTSRKLEDLSPAVQARARAFLGACAAQGLDVLVTCTLRDYEAQAALFAQGRTAPGPIVTNARPGESWHQFGCALDVVPLRNGKPVWGTKGADGTLWALIGDIGQEHGLEWAGRWSHFREMPHFQHIGGLTLEQARAGKRPV